MRARAAIGAPPPVQPWRFPAIADPVAVASPTLDPAKFIAVLADKLGGMVGMPVMVTCDDVAVAAPLSSGFVRGDGMRIVLTVPAELVGALVGVRCGGRFVPASAAGAGGASVAGEVTAAVLAAADAAWPGGSGWQPTDCGAATPVLALTLAVEGYGFSLPCAVVLAPTMVTSAPDTSDWSRRLHAALDATPFAVRAVLHDHVVPLRDALAIRVGDVLPIETRRDVSLRLGDRALARGTIAPDDDGGHRITIVAVGDPGITSAKELS